MEKRTVADCIAGIDELICSQSPPPPNRDLLRIALADFLQRHRTLSDHLEDGAEPVWLVTDGTIPFWPDNAEINDLGVPRNGAELYPIALAVLADVDQTTDLLESAEIAMRSLAPLIAADNLAALVAADFCEALVFAGLAARA